MTLRITITDNNDSGDTSTNYVSTVNTRSIQTRATINILTGVRHPNRYCNYPLYRGRKRRTKVLGTLFKSTPYAAELGSEPMHL